MVIIQPFEYEKTTAFKERVQIANKVNEIINLFNDLDIESKINIFNEEIEIINGKITEINNALVEVNDAVDTVEGYNTRLTSVENESVSLDARLDNIEPVVSSDNAKIGVLENKDLQNVKLSGNQTIADIKTFSSSPIVPNPPSGDTSTKAVNTNWISQTGDSAPNNLVHRYGNETMNGQKNISGLFRYYPTNEYDGYMMIRPGLDWGVTPPETSKRYRIIQINGDSGNYCLRLNMDLQTDGTVRLQYEKRDIVNGESVYRSGYLI